MTESNVDNVNAESVQPDTVAFRSKDISSTQSKHSPTYFTNVKDSKHKPTKSTKIIIAVCAILVIALIATAITLSLLSRNSNDDADSGQQDESTSEDQQDDGADVPEEAKNNQVIIEIMKNPAYSIEQANKIIDEKIANETDQSTAFRYNIMRILWLSNNGDLNLALSLLQQIDDSTLSDEQLLSYYSAMRFVHEQLGHSEEAEYYYQKSIEKEIGDYE